MNLKQRSALLRARFGRLSKPKAALATPSEPRGLVRSKAAPGPAPRKGITKPAPGNWTFKTFDRNAELSLELRRSKWLETSGVPEKDRLVLKRPAGVSPLVKIAAHFHVKTPRPSA